MASTYSTNLRLELIGTGDQAGVWGATTNNNLGTLLDEAIAGVQSVTCSGTNTVLTVNDGITDQSRAAVLVLTGIPGGAFSVFAPPGVSKTYTVLNNVSTYNATIYLSTTLGGTTPLGTGVVIPAGKSVQVWTDGVNGFYVSDSLVIGGTAGNPLLSTGTGAAPAFGKLSLGTADANVTGVLQVANGGTGIGTVAAGSLLYSPSTGFWAALAVSPTAGAVLRVSTGLPEWGTVDLSSSGSVANTLRATNGGTGQSSAFTQYGVVYGASSSALGVTAAAGGTDYFLVGSPAAYPSFKSASTLGLITTAGGSISGSLSLTGTVTATGGFTTRDGAGILLNKYPGDPGNQATISYYNGTYVAFSKPISVVGGLLVSSGGAEIAGGVDVTSGNVTIENANRLRLYTSGNSSYADFYNDSGTVTTTSDLSVGTFVAQGNVLVRDGHVLGLNDTGNAHIAYIGLASGSLFFTAPYGGDGTYPQLSNVQRYTAGNGTITANSGCEYLFIDCNLTSATIYFPPSALDGQKFTVTMWQSFSATGISWNGNGANLSAGPPSLSYTTAASWVYLAVTAAWFRVS